jgi:hypothetical protein
MRVSSPAKLLFRTFLVRTCFLKSVLRDGPAYNLIPSKRPMGAPSKLRSGRISLPLCDSMPPFV